MTRLVAKCSHFVTRDIAGEPDMRWQPANWTGQSGSTLGGGGMSPKGQSKRATECHIGGLIKVGPLGEQLGKPSVFASLTHKVHGGTVSAVFSCASVAIT